MQAAGPLDAFEVAFDAGHPLLDEAAVSLDLGFAGTAEEAKTAALTFQMGPRSNQPRFLVGEMGELDRQRAFSRSCPAAKNFEDQSGAIDDLGRKRIFEIALLHRRQGAIHDNEIDQFRAYQSRKPGDFAFGEITRRPDLRKRSDLPRDNFKANRLGKP